MLYAFSVRNFKNIKEYNKLVFFNRETVVYGACASGKTNLCQAIGNILGEEKICNIDNINALEFEYKFILDGTEIVYCYSRDSRGNILWQEIKIPDDDFQYRREQDCCEYNVFFSQITDRFGLMKKLLNYLSGIRLIIGKELLEDNAHFYTSNSMEENDIFENSTLVVCDDADQMFSDLEGRNYEQIIYTTRKISWLNKFTKEPQSCYCIENGKIFEVNELTDKNLDTMPKLCNFLRHLP
ncbi:MAG: hypothetical protein NC489_32300 [Ruminococcus flavefaciens]|nr:hypothetical protein [Ruminococcus flavefaciens]